MTTFVTREELLNHLLINPDTLTQYQKDGLPIHKKGAGRSRAQYILEDVINWLDANGKKYGATKESLQEAKTRRECALASLAELELQEAEGKLVRIDEITREYEKQLINLKQKLLAIPTKTAGLVVGNSDINHVKSIIEDEIRTCLEEISK